MEIAKNRKARFNYEVLETYEAGIELQGTEVRSCRNKSISISEGFVSFENGEAWLRETHISTYEQGNRNNHEPKRKRRLLLHKKEIKEIREALDERRLTLVPLSLNIRRGRAKIELGIARGLKNYDKRRKIQEREQNRQIARALRHSI